LVKSTAALLKNWIQRHRRGESDFLFPSSSGGRLSADAVQRLVHKHATVAKKICPSLAKKRVTPHVLRHTAAMELLQAGIDRSLIAIWLGHESIETTEPYLDANLALKEEILAKTRSIRCAQRRFRPDDSLMGFLKNL
jgi:integrase